ncbi:hypothetical protein OSTOST_00259 [Ostertagia ostertagi]
MTSPSVNFEEDSGIIKSGPVVAGFAPIKSRKNYYAVLCERALELHESEKTYRKRKSARHLIDLSIAFNLHNEHVSDVKFLFGITKYNNTTAMNHFTALQQQLQSDTIDEFQLDQFSD